VALPILQDYFSGSIVQKISKNPRRSGEIEAIKVHHLGPRRDEVFPERLLGVRAGIDLRQRPQLRVRAEDIR
jgi:hypothetical protein